MGTSTKVDTKKESLMVSDSIIGVMEAISKVISKEECEMESVYGRGHKESLINTRANI